MTWRRASDTPSRAKYSCTVNIDKHPELGPLADYLWNLTPVPTERNQAIIELLKAGFEATHPTPAVPPGTQAQEAPVRDKRTASSPSKLRRPTTQLTSAPTLAPVPVGPQGEAFAPPAATSAAASRFLHQFDEDPPTPSLVVN